MARYRRPRIRPGMSQAQINELHTPCPRCLRRGMSWEMPPDADGVVRRQCDACKGTWVVKTPGA